MQSTPSTTSESPSAPTSKITRGHSCVLCQQRKVRCDRQKPCSNCTKARVECVPSAPAQPRRRRRKLTETDLTAKIRKYEQLLKYHDIKVVDDDGPDSNSTLNEVRNGVAENKLSMHVPRARNAEKGLMFADDDNSHYVENTLWENLRDEIQDPKEPLQPPSDDEVNETGLYPDPERFIMGYGASSQDLTSLHPPPVQIFRLWQTFLVNVNPMVKMFHAPTVQQTILDASGDLQNVSRPTEALMFAIYFLSVHSLRNEECERLFRESRSTLIAKYSHGAQQALVNARFLKSLNLYTLQAMCLYLLGVRRTLDPHSLWVLSGMVVRIAQRLGLHRDGSNYKISPFDAEIRRRTWWGIVFLDGHASKLAGAGFPAWMSQFDTKLPLNISDSDMSPAMKEPPKEKGGATEMLFCCLRYEVGESMRNSGAALRQDGVKSLSNFHVPKGVDLMEQKDRAIEELEARFEDMFLRYCDPAIPLHLLVIYTAKSVVCTMRIMAHHPRQYPDKGASMPQKEKDLMFFESLKELEYDNAGHTLKVFQGYLWYIHSHFQLDAFIYLISELRHRTSGELVERAWEQIALSFEHRPELITEMRNSLYGAIGNLTLKAWQKREDVIGPQVPIPRFISVLRKQRNIPEPALPESKYQTSTVNQRERMPQYQNNGTPQMMQPSNTYPASGGPYGSNDLDFDMGMPEINPVDWQYWQTLMDGDLPAYNGSDTTSQLWIT